jgi:transcriptional regulator with XRE-family HTH domain
MLSAVYSHTAISYAPRMAGVGGALRKLRKPKMTQEAFGEALRVSQALVSQWERDETVPNAEQLVQIALTLDCTVEDLVAGVDPAYNDLRRRLSDKEKQTDVTPRVTDHAVSSKQAQPIGQAAGGNPRGSAPVENRLPEPVVDTDLDKVRDLHAIEELRNIASQLSVLHGRLMRIVPGEPSAPRGETKAARSKGDSHLHGRGARRKRGA